MIFGGGRNAGKIASAEDWQAKVDRILFFYANGLSREEALARLKALGTPTDAAGRWLDRAHLTHGKG
jgi:hypothetical protein